MWCVEDKKNSPEPLESIREYKEARAVRTPLLPRHVCSSSGGGGGGAGRFLIVCFHVLHQRATVHHEARGLPVVPLRRRVVVEGKDVHACGARCRERRVGRRAREERARSRRELEQDAMAQRRGQVQRGHVRRPPGRRRSAASRAAKAVDANLAAIFERRDHVRARRKERKVPDAFWRLGLLNKLKKKKQSKLVG